MSTSLTLPVVEIFGPTLQGEGPFIGTRCIFVRLAGCDYRCSWCDTTYSWHRPIFSRMTPAAIAEEVIARERFHPRQVCLTGGNPLIHDGVIELLNHPSNINYWVETQGTVPQEWMNHWKVSHLVISPKLSSSGMTQTTHDVEFFLSLVTRPHERAVLKVVVFDDLDVEEALQSFYYPLRWRVADFTFSVGTKPEDTSEDILERWRGITDYLLRMRLIEPNFRVLPQAHVLLFGHKKGV